MVPSLNLLSMNATDPLGRDMTAPTAAAIRRGVARISVLLPALFIAGCGGRSQPASECSDCGGDPGGPPVVVGPPTWTPLANGSWCGIEYLAHASSLESVVRVDPCVGLSAECDRLVFEPNLFGSPGLLQTVQAMDSGRATWLLAIFSGSWGMGAVVVREDDGAVAGAYRSVSNPACRFGSVALGDDRFAIEYSKGDMYHVWILGALQPESAAISGKRFTTEEYHPISGASIVGRRLAWHLFEGGLSSSDVIDDLDPLDFASPNWWGAPQPSPDLFLVPLQSLDEPETIYATDGLGVPWLHIGTSDGSSVGAPRYGAPYLFWMRGYMRDASGYGRTELWASLYESRSENLKPFKLSDTSLQNLSYSAVAGWGAYAVRDPGRNSLQLWRAPSGEHRELAMPESLWLAAAAGMAREHAFIVVTDRSDEQQAGTLVKVRVDTIPTSP
jgi:hypothetical protein